MHSTLPKSANLLGATQFRLRTGEVRPGYTSEVIVLALDFRSIFDYLAPSIPVVELQTPASIVVVSYQRPLARELSYLLYCIRLEQTWILFNSIIKIVSCQCMDILDERVLGCA